MAPIYSTDRVWDNEEQNVSVFNWTEVLEEWNESLTMHPYVQTVIDNLKAVSDPDSETDFPLSHFLKYLNWEKDGISWLLYEIVSMRWMWGETRLDFVKELVHRPDVKLDEGFPFFPGSPRNFRTIRKFLVDSLSTEEVEYLEMPMRNNSSQREIINSPPRIQRSVSSNNPPPAPVKVNKKYSDIQLFLQRPDVNGKGQPDDTIRIVKESYLLHSIKYKDGVCDVSYTIPGLGKGEVIEYIRNVVNLNRADRQGFEYIQLSSPGAPSVLLPQYTTAEERDLMYDAIERTIDNWPVSA
jgi:hypothetical protein